MIKYAISITKENNKKILAICDTKEQAMEKGEEYKKQFSKDSGILSCISADFDENNNRTDKKYKLIHSWI